MLKQKKTNQWKKVILFFHTNKTLAVMIMFIGTLSAIFGILGYFKKESSTKIELHPIEKKSTTKSDSMLQNSVITHGNNSPIIIGGNDVSVDYSNTDTIEKKYKVPK